VFASNNISGINFAVLLSTLYETVAGTGPSGPVRRKLSAVSVVSSTGTPKVAETTVLSTTFVAALAGSVVSAKGREMLGSLPAPPPPPHPARQKKRTTIVPVTILLLVFIGPLLDIVGDDTVSEGKAKWMPNMKRGAMA
jgi:hypothetical protein